MPMSSAIEDLTLAARTARAQFEAEGYCFAPRLLSDETLERANQICDRIIATDYATGVPPHAVSWKPGDDPNLLVKIDQPQRADHGLSQVLVDSGIGAFAAGLMGANMVQAWAVQLLHKPPNTDTGSLAVVGWHQDDDYWHEWWDGEVFTCWLALSDVTIDSGPMNFVPGSHRWGFLKSGNFFNNDLDSQRQGMPVPEGQTWREVPAVLAPGAASFHHRRTVHGSSVNQADWPRRSLAVHIRTERSRPLTLAPEGYQDDLADPRICPALYGTP
jgi:hypothetical protein